MNSKEKQQVSEILKSHEAERNIHEKIIVGYNSLIKSYKNLLRLYRNSGIYWPIIFFALGYLYGFGNNYIFALAFLSFYVFIEILFELNTRKYNKKHNKK